MQIHSSLSVVAEEVPERLCHGYRNAARTENQYAIHHDKELGLIDVRLQLALFLAPAFRRVAILI